MDNEVMNLEVESLNASSPTDIIASGAAMMQTKAQYTTAVQVIKKRNVQSVIQSVNTEAALAGDDFYYSWGKGKYYVEGISIVGAEIIARNWGNCAVNARIEEKADAYIFYGDFIDFETGYNNTRPFRAAKKVLKRQDGSAIYDNERNDDIVFQIGVSKCQRNAIIHSVPRYVQDAAIEKAKEGIKKKLTNMGLEKAAAMIEGKANKLKVPIERIETTFGKKNKWDIDKLILISGALRSFEDGYGTLDDIFPSNGFPCDDSEKNKTSQAAQDNNSRASSLEVEKATSVKEESKKEQPKKEEPPVDIKQAEITFDESNPETLENPKYHLWKISKFQGDIQAWNKFKKENIKYWSQFSGLEYESIENLINDKEKEILSPKKR